MKVLALLTLCLCSCVPNTKSLTIKPSFTFEVSTIAMTETEGVISIDYKYPACLLESKETKTVSVSYQAEQTEANKPSLLALVVRGLLKFISDVLL